MQDQKKVIKLTKMDGETPVLIGTESIIRVELIELGKTKITSREAMACTTFVIESVVEIFEQIENYQS